MADKHTSWLDHKLCLYIYSLTKALKNPAIILSGSSRSWLDHGVIIGVARVWSRALQTEGGDIFFFVLEKNTTCSDDRRMADRSKASRLCYRTALGDGGQSVLGDSLRSEKSGGSMNVADTHPPTHTLAFRLCSLFLSHRPRRRARRPSSTGSHEVHARQSHAADTTTVRGRVTTAAATAAAVAAVRSSGGEYHSVARHMCFTRSPRVQIRASVRRPLGATPGDISSGSTP